MMGDVEKRFAAHKSMSSLGDLVPLQDDGFLQKPTIVPTPPPSSATPATRDPKALLVRTTTTSSIPRPRGKLPLRSKSSDGLETMTIQRDNNQAPVKRSCPKRSTSAIGPKREKEKEKSTGKDTEKVSSKDKKEKSKSTTSTRKSAEIPNMRENSPLHDIINNDENNETGKAPKMYDDHDDNLIQKRSSLRTMKPMDEMIALSWIEQPSKEQLLDNGGNKEKKKSKERKSNGEKIHKDQKKKVENSKKQKSSLKDKLSEKRKKRDKGEIINTEDSSVASSVVNPPKTKISASEWDSLHEPSKDARKANPTEQPQQKQSTTEELSWFGFAAAPDRDDSSRSLENSFEDARFSSIGRENNAMEDSISVIDLIQAKEEQDEADDINSVSSEDQDSTSDSSDSDDESTSNGSSTSSSSDSSQSSASSKQKRAARDASAAKKRAAQLRKLERKKRQDEKASRKKATRKPPERTRSSSRESASRSKRMHNSVRSTKSSSCHRCGSRATTIGAGALHTSISRASMGTSCHNRPPQLSSQQDPFAPLSQSATKLDPFGFQIEDDAGDSGGNEQVGNDNWVAFDNGQNNRKSFRESSSRHDRKAGGLQRARSYDTSTAPCVNNNGSRGDGSRRGSRRIMRTTSFDDNPHHANKGRRGRRQDAFHSSLGNLNGSRHGRRLDDLNSSKSSLHGSRHGRRSTSGGDALNGLNSSKNNLHGSRHVRRPDAFNDLHSSKSSLHGSRHVRPTGEGDPVTDLSSSKSGLHGCGNSRRGGRSSIGDNAVEDLSSSISSLNASTRGKDCNNSMSSLNASARGRAGRGRQHVRNLQDSALKLSLEQNQDHLAFVQSGKWMTEKEREANAPPRIQAWEKRRKEKGK